VVVLAGKGNNGADGRAAVSGLSRRGVRCVVVDAADAPAELPACDLVIDAAYGTGFRGSFDAPEIDAPLVLAVDIPSGVDGDTGAVGGSPLAADATVTFAALKPGLVIGDGRELAGVIDVADIGLAVDGASIHLVEDVDVALWLPKRSPSSHKWETAVRVVAGSDGMTGAASLTAAAAMRGGAGYVALGVPGAPSSLSAGPVEAVTDALPAVGWADAVLANLGRFSALAVGPGLGRDEGTMAEVRRLVAAADLPVVIDADGLAAYDKIDGAPFAQRAAATVLTPHDGEFARLMGGPPGVDRIAACRELARRSGAVVLLKGSTTVVADPEGDVLLAASGSARLATAGTGDVLTGIVAAFLAGGLLPDLAAALAAHAHGSAASLGPSVGLVASDLVNLLPTYFDRVSA
ncbi:MAG: NAD(P)H-hydrate dehydratase, partial [Acidimicrobiales bacterium]